MYELSQPAGASNGSNSAEIGRGMGRGMGRGTAQPRGENLDFTSRPGCRSADWAGLSGSVDPHSPKSVSDSAITSLAASIKTPQIAAYDKTETLSIWNIESGLKIASTAITDSPVTTMVYSDHDDFVIAGHLSGALTFFTTTTAQPIASLTSHPQPIINFHQGQ